MKTIMPKIGLFASAALAMLMVSCGDDAPSCESYDATTHFCDTRDNKLYRYVSIGSKTWMAENLNYEYKVDGSTYGNWCYNNSADSCAKYGRLYTWGAAMDSAVTGCGYYKTCSASSGRVKGVCPTGWHLPSAVEWSVLIAAVGGVDSSWAKLKSTSGWSSNDGTDAYGFSALPSGDRHGNGHFDNAGDYAYLWSSSEDNQGNAYYMDLYCNVVYAYQCSYYKNFGFAVRCLRD